MIEKTKKTFIILGIIIAIVPFLGIPYSWKTFLFVVIGLGIAITAFFIGKDLKKFLGLEKHSNIEKSQTEE